MPTKRKSTTGKKKLSAKKPAYAPLTKKPKTEFQEALSGLTAAQKEFLKNAAVGLKNGELSTLKAKKLLQQKPAERKRAEFLSPYMAFVASERAKVQAEHPEMSFQALGREMGTRWKNLPEPEKNKIRELKIRPKSAGAPVPVAIPVATAA